MLDVVGRPLTPDQEMGLNLLRKVEEGHIGTVAFGEQHPPAFAVVVAEGVLATAHLIEVERPVAFDHALALAAQQLGEVIVVDTGIGVDDPTFVEGVALAAEAHETAVELIAETDISVAA
jgi:hypothetical protein